MAPKTSVVSRSPRSLILPPASLGWSASSFSLFWPDMYGGRFQISPRELPRFLTNKRRAQETGLEKEAPAGEVPSWPMTSTGRCVARMLDAWGLSTGTPRKYQLIYGTRLINCPLQWAGLCRGRASAGGGPWRPARGTAGIRKLEEGLRLEKDLWVSTDQVGEQENKSDSLAHHFC